MFASLCSSKARSCSQLQPTLWKYGDQVVCVSTWFPLHGCFHSRGRNPRDLWIWISNYLNLNLRYESCLFVESPLPFWWQLSFGKVFFLGGSLAAPPPWIWSCSLSWGSFWVCLWRIGCFEEFLVVLELSGSRLFLGGGVSGCISWNVQSLRVFCHRPACWRLFALHPGGICCWGMWFWRICAHLWFVDITYRHNQLLLDETSSFTWVVCVGWCVALEFQDFVKVLV